MISVRLEDRVETLRDSAQKLVDFELTQHAAVGIGTKLIMGGDVGYFARSTLAHQ